MSNLLTNNVYTMSFAAQKQLCGTHKKAVKNAVNEKRKNEKLRSGAVAPLLNFSFFTFHFSFRFLQPQRQLKYALSGFML